MSDTSLLGDTIGENFDKTVARFPDRDALVDIPARALPAWRKVVLLGTPEWDAPR